MLLAGALLLACRRPTGALTVINLGESAITGTVAAQTFSIPPQEGWTWEAAPLGEQSVEWQGAPAKTVTITEGHTTVVDVTGQGCFVVADYRKQYGERSTGDVVIAERFQAQATFTPKQALTVVYGRPLPSEAPEGTGVRRLQQVDCALLENETQLVDTLARLP